MARIRKRKYKNKILNVEVVREKDNNKMINIEKKTEQITDWFKKNKKAVILTSYIFTPVLIVWGMIAISIPKNFPINSVKAILIYFCTLPLLIHYLYLMLETYPENYKGFFIKLKNYFKNIPLDFLLIIGLFAYLVIPPNKTLNSCVILFISAYIAYIISKLVLKIKQSIQDSFNDKEKFKMYMQLTNKILLTIITLVGSILTILLTIKQLLS